MAVRFLRIFSLVRTSDTGRASYKRASDIWSSEREDCWPFDLNVQHLQSAGPPDPNKTIFVRQSSTVVCTAGIAHSMTIEPRDEYDNLCIFGPGDEPTEGYNVNITQVNERTGWWTKWSKMKVSIFLIELDDKSLSLTDR